jgi:F-type H+-transporting ATPase subunit epsilon
MRLKILLPTRVFLDEAVTKVVAEAENGSFCLEPNHVDFVTSLDAGILSYTESEGQEVFVAVNRGVLVKRGPQVMVSTRDAVRGPELGTLRHTVEQRFEQESEEERQARTALAKLEARFARGVLETTRE